MNDRIIAAAFTLLFWAAGIIHPPEVLCVAVVLLIPTFLRMAVKAATDLRLVRTRVDTLAQRRLRQDRADWIRRHKGHEQSS